MAKLNFELTVETFDMAREGIEGWYELRLQAIDDAFRKYWRDRKQPEKY